MAEGGRRASGAREMELRPRPERARVSVSGVRGAEWAVPEESTPRISGGEGDSGGHSAEGRRVWRRSETLSLDGSGPERARGGEGGEGGEAESSVIV